MSTHAEVREPVSDTGWAYCQTELRGMVVTPVSVAITYLEPDLDAAVTGEQIRSWFGTVDPLVVDVYKLAHKNGTRRVALEISRAKWAPWDQVAGQRQGTAVCGLVRSALLAAEVGRPVPERDLGEVVKPARHHFEFIYARRPKLYDTVEWAGTLAHVLEGEQLVALQAWLAGTDA